MGKLVDEKNRWQTTIHTLENHLKTLPEQSLLSAGFITYLSQSDENERAKYQELWLKKINLGHFSFRQFLARESDILKAKLKGLPSDDLSIENSIILQNVQEVPLLIDPNSSATQYLMNSVTGEVTTPNDPKLINTLENAVRFGKPVILKELDHVEGLLVNVLRKDVVAMGSRKQVKLGEKWLDYSEEFQIFLCTRNNEIQIAPTEASLLKVINFTVTKSGLEGKLLSVIINKEKPEIEQKKSQCLKESEDLTLMMNQLETNLLNQLASSSGNILENEILIANLNETKVKSIKIKESLESSKALQEDLDQQRNAYRPLAQKAASLFININDLQKINSMYRFSLHQYQKLFERSLEVNTNIEHLAQKLEVCLHQLFENVINDMGTGLFKEDKLLFALHMLRAVNPELVPKKEYEFFLSSLIDT